LLGLAVLAVVGVLVQYTPARTETEAAAAARAVARAQPFERTVETAQDVSVKLEVAPNTVGTNTFLVSLSPAPGGEVGDVRRVVVRLQAPEGSADDEEVVANPTGPDSYKAVGSFFTEPGRWTIRVDVQRASLGDASAAFQVGVQGSSVGTTRGSFAFPLVVGNWASVTAAGMVVASLLILVSSGHPPAWSKWRRRATTGSAFALAVVGIVLLLAVNVVGPSEGSAFKEAAVAFRYQAQDGRFVLLEIDPFQVGQNRFRITTLDQREQPVEVNAVDLRFSRLERPGVLGEAAARPDAKSLSYLAQYQLAETGWWNIDVILDATEVVSFYLRLDAPSQAPLTFAPPDYESDPAAEALFRKTVQAYEGLSALKWREELTSGLLAPTGIGAWVVTDGEAEAPDKVHLSVLSLGYSSYELYRVAEKGCSRDQGGSWQCSTSEFTGEAFELDYLQAATAFRLGRREMMDGEMTQLLLFNNPSQAGAWFAWWVGEETGHLRKQAMVAPGHFMLTRFFDHDVPIGITLPPVALQQQE